MNIVNPKKLNSVIVQLVSALMIGLVVWIQVIIFGYLIPILGWIISILLEGNEIPHA